MQSQEFRLKPSKRYVTILSVLLLATVTIIVCQPISLWIKAMLLLFVVPYGSWVMLRFGLLRSQRSILALKFEGEGRWVLQTPEGTVTAELSGDSTVTNLACVLRFKVPGEFWTQTCIVFRDSLDAERYQQLIAVLRMY